MTPEQIAAFSTDIANNNDPVIVEALSKGNNGAIQNWYNGDAFPDTWIFIDNLNINLVVGAVDWSGEYLSFQDDIPAIQLLFAAGYDPRLPNSRDALNTLFTGAPNSKQGILSLAVRLCSYVEEIFLESTTGPGGGDGKDQAHAANVTYIGPCTINDVRQAVALIG